MPIENEYKYVLRYDDDLPDTTRAYASRIRQGYLYPEVRIRMVDLPGVKGAPHTTCFFTFKSMTDDGLVELEHEIDLIDFERLWPKTGNRLEKTRFTFLDDDNHWDVDLFGAHDDPYFVLAEVEVAEGRPDPGICQRLAAWLIKPVGKDPAFLSYKLSDESYARNLMHGLQK